jgi:hypothetical protein
MHVLFGRPNGEKTMGEVVKINAASVKVKQTEPQPRGARLELSGASPPRSCSPSQRARSSRPPPRHPVYNAMSPENLSRDGGACRSHGC